MNRFQKILLILVLSVGVAGSVLAQKPALRTGLQGQALIDSLLKELPKQKEDTNKANLLWHISVDYWNIDPDEGIKYGQQDLDLTAKLAWKKGIGRANLALGINFKYKSDNASALVYFAKAEKIFEELDFKKGIANVLGNIGTVYVSEGDYPKALEYYFKASKMLEELDDKVGVALITGNIGNIYYLQSDYARALEYYFKALKMNEQTGNKAGFVIYTGNIGLVYSALNDYPNALEYYFKDLNMAKELGNKNEEARVTENIGSVYEARKEYPKAMEYYLKALQINQDIGNKQGEGQVTVKMGVIYASQKNYLMAITYCMKGLQMNEAIGDKYQEAWALYQVGFSYLSLAEDTAANKISGTGEFPAARYKTDGAIPAGRVARLLVAINYMTRALDTAKKIHTLDVMKDCYEGLAKAYKLSGDYKQAMESYQNYTAIKDSIFSKDNEKKLMRSAMQYDYDKAHLADSLKNTEKEKINRIELKRQRSYTYIGIAGALLLLGFSFFMLRNNKLLGNEKKRSDDLLLNILPSEVAQELKTKGNSTARQYENVTVLFTDFVNFTQAAEKLSPQALIDELHTCFKTFDEITAKYNIEKIKTIGDAYLAVAGLPVADPKHAENIVRAAIEISSFMADRYAKLGDRTFEVRIGIHSGSVVAGIVGVKKFAYDIWGDTVNTAARMEQNCETGKINISQATYELVKDKFSYEYRGEIDAKGKGEMKMYYVKPLTPEGGPRI